MANTKTQLEVEHWIRQVWMKDQFNQEFESKNLELSSGGLFNFDAVSRDGKIVANISTSSDKTSGGRPGIGKRMKVRSDLYFLILLSDAERRIQIFSEHDMCEFWREEKLNGRMPKEIEIFHAEIPEDLRTRLQISRKIAADEVKPGTRQKN